MTFLGKFVNSTYLHFVQLVVVFAIMMLLGEPEDIVLAEDLMDKAETFVNASRRNIRKRQKTLFSRNLREMLLIVHLHACALFCLDSSSRPTNIYLV
ncbi:hypothetical protein L596_028096 [Steinernema carpocapsae]|uniref:Uncharacterized protein n=1 Tax=Steinernema carpocapsae TaxID=34508 RepID=A0A4V5ZXS1_STECR|nr:hypothetical protein L596_028096 [Steinernema carpocapsae]